MDGVEIFEYTIDNPLLEKLKTLANLKEENITFLDKGFKFVFERSLIANQCMVVKYMDGYIVEFRKKTDNLIEGKTDKLIFERVIKKEEFSDTFQRITGIYLDYI